MNTKPQTTKQAEAFIRKVLAKSFKQKIDPETLRTVAQKVLRTIPSEAPKKVQAA